MEETDKYWGKLKLKTKMKQQDFDMLKAICDKEGFECFEPSNIQDEPIFIIRKKKDIWEGVEFVEDKISHKVYILNRFVDRDSFVMSFYKPSAEFAYIEQLKKDAFERFGVIQEGDRFMNPNGLELGCESTGFDYYNDCDALLFGNVFIYKSGKWATKLPKRIDVRAREMDSYTSKNHSTVKFDIIGKSLESEDAHKLASQLEKYLNNEPIE